MSEPIEERSPCADSATRRRHAHQFHALWSHFGQYGPQEVHYHPCSPDDEKPCDAILLGDGRDCDGKRDTHVASWLGEQEQAVAALTQVTGNDAPFDLPPKITTTVARWFHEAYEQLAPTHGYRTRKASAVQWEDVPAANKALMFDTVAVVLSRLADAGVDLSQFDGYPATD